MNKVDPIREMAMLGKTVMDQYAIDVGQQVLRVARVIDSCKACGAIQIILGSHQEEKTFEELIMYHFGGHNIESQEEADGGVSQEQKMDRYSEKDTKGE